MFERVLTDAVAALLNPATSLYVYGSVATGTARPGSSDVDFLAIDLPDAAAVGERLSTRYVDLCRGVEIASATAHDFEGDTDDAYGNRVFLRHYCVHLAGPDPAVKLPAFPADARAARGFNGDIGRHLRRWRQRVAEGSESPDLVGVRAARKSLLALAGLVSVHDHTWTTDRARAVERWSEIEPGLATELARLRMWVNGEQRPTRAEVEQAIGAGGIVPAIVQRFSDRIGLWSDARRKSSG